MFRHISEESEVPFDLTSIFLIKFKDYKTDATLPVFIHLPARFSTPELFFFRSHRGAEVLSSVSWFAFHWQLGGFVAAGGVISIHSIRYALPKEHQRSVLLHQFVVPANPSGATAHGKIWIKSHVTVGLECQQWRYCQSREKHASNSVH